MKTIRAASLGYCMGVRRAMAIALRESSDGEGTRRVWCLGPLIHNPQALADLESAGATTCRDLDALVARARPGDIVIIRAHGVSPATHDALVAQGFVVVDATCPRVKTSQRIAADHSSRGRLVALAGDPDHGEIAGIAGHAVDCVVVSSPADADRVPADREVSLIGQTTITRDEYDAIASALRARVRDLVVVDSICPATRERLEAVIALKDEVEAVVVVGGRESANTARLFRAALDSGIPAWHVETEEELPEEIARFASVGVSAGASTPDRLIDAVVSRLESL